MEVWAARAGLRPAPTGAICVVAKVGFAVVLGCRNMNGWWRDLRMCLNRGLLVLVQAAICLFLVFGTALGVQGQTDSGGQAAESGAAREARVQEGLPAEWDAGVKVLAGKIAAEVKPARAVSLEVKSISSLGAAEVEAIREGLEGELTSRGIRVGAGETAVTVTLSENVEGSVWVAEIQRNDKEDRAARIAIVSVSKAARTLTGGKTESLAISKRLVWQQPTEFLDFLIGERPTTVMSSILIILEPDRLVYYRSTTLQWQLQEAIPFPHAGNGNRHFQGRISTSFQKVWGPGGECSGDLGDPATVKCSSKVTVLAGAHLGLKIPGHETYQGELLDERCADKSVALVSGNGDWTQPDSLQGYLFSDVMNPDAVPSGGAVEFDGPIMSMKADDRESMRVIAHNLKTGNFEGYIVTATCNH
jgi:hypothetical protein